MGHANLSNISRFFNRRIYALGVLSIEQCIHALQAAGETLHASEGEYDDDGTLGMGVMDVVHYLTRPDPTTEGYSGPRGGGPWIEPLLRTKDLPIKASRNRERDSLLVKCGLSNATADDFAIAADFLEEEGLAEWAAYVRLLPQMRKLYRIWEEDGDDWYDDQETFDRILWRFAPGKRRHYRDMPTLGSVTH